ncbi:hypothetical protein KIPB_003085 [Kipferlia bialata]|nr:hypothetical protein KIPB_001274 [Kipferlia bialata]GIQ82018.1 hypothetical protein KIPB_003085 [Kipferlia bialata]|eukprot:g1274.t1
MPLDPHEYLISVDIKPSERKLLQRMYLPVRQTQLNSRDIAAMVEAKFPLTYADRTYKTPGLLKVLTSRTCGHRFARVLDSFSEVQLAKLVDSASSHGPLTQRAPYRIDQEGTRLNIKDVFTSAHLCLIMPIGPQALKHQHQASTQASTQASSQGVPSVPMDSMAGLPLPSPLDLSMHHGVAGVTHQTAVASPPSIPPSGMGSSSIDGMEGVGGLEEQRERERERERDRNRRMMQTLEMGTRTDRPASDAPPQGTGWMGPNATGTERPPLSGTMYSGEGYTLAQTQKGQGEREGERTQGPLSQPPLLPTNPHAHPTVPTVPTDGIPRVRVPRGSRERETGPEGEDQVDAYVATSASEYTVCLDVKPSQRKCLERLYFTMAKDSLSVANLALRVQAYFPAEYGGVTYEYPDEIHVLTNRSIGHKQAPTLGSLSDIVLKQIAFRQESRTPGMLVSRHEYVSDNGMGYTISRHNFDSAHISVFVRVGGGTPDPASMTTLPGTTVHRPKRKYTKVSPTAKDVPPPPPPSQGVGERDR